MYKQGTTGNPRGRPRKAWGQSQKLRELIDTPKLLRQIEKQAFEGDVAAQKLLLDRVLPPLRNEAKTLKLTPAQRRKAVESIQQQMLNGEIAPDNAGTAFEAMDKANQLTRLAELEARLKSLEDDSNAPK